MVEYAKGSIVRVMENKKGHPDIGTLIHTVPTDKLPLGHVRPRSAIKIFGESTLIDNSPGDREGQLTP